MIRKAIFINALFFLIYLPLSSQISRQGIQSPQLPSSPGEKISLYTDRNIYCVNEKIFFTAGYSCIDELDTLSWSTVLYIELIRWNGNKLAMMKLNLTRQGASGSMQIPATLLSGNYYLRAYTKWMRNFSPQEYAYLLVKIVNPFRSEIDEGPAAISVSSESGMPGYAQKPGINGIIFTNDKNTYKPGEKAEVGISLDGGNLTGSDSYCISVVKADAIDTAVQSFEPGLISPRNSLNYVEYLPEIRGITISGKIIDRSARLPVKNVLVNLSETGYGEYFAVYQTNDSGRFLFSLPEMKGEHDFFIQAESSSEILIDDSYCSQPVKLPFVPFSLYKDETDYAREMIINQQLSERFREKEDKPADSQQTKKAPEVFYSNKKAIYLTDKYIELPDIEEFISEIVTEAIIIKEKNKASFISMKRNDLLYHLPLILLDNIQVNNDDHLLKISLDRIEKVEVISRDYIVGSLKYDGIISIYSKNKDFAGLDLNKSSMFFTYDIFSETDTIPYSLRRSPDVRIPDRRNLLYWNPDIRLSADSKTTISFYTPDVPGKYVVYVRRKNNPDGPEIYGKYCFLIN